MKKSMTLKDIAKHFEVSVSTVSKALNDSHDISTELKDKIQGYARKMHYRPNPYATNLRKKTNKTIAVIVPNVLNFFFAQVFSGIEKVANESGYNLISCFSNESYSKEKNTIEILQDGPVSGLLISLAEETEKLGNYDHLIRCIDNGLPVVMFDRVHDSIECDKVLVDDYNGAYSAVEHLIKTGCRHISIVSPLHNLNIGKQRLQGYTDALKAHNLPVDPNLIIKIYDKELFEAEVRAMLTRHKVDAILGLEEYSAINSMQIAMQLGFRVPEDISVMGFTNGQLPKYVTPKLTTISQHGKYIGELAARKLITRLEENTDSTPVYTNEMLKTSIILRDSTRKV